MKGLKEAICAMTDDHNMPEDIVRRHVETFLLAAYQKEFGSDDNAEVIFADIDDEVTLYARKTIVEEVDNPVTELSLEEGLKLNSDAELGDTFLLEIEPKSFSRASVMVAKQKASELIRNHEKDAVMSKWGPRVNEIVVGYIQRERRGDFFIDLGDGIEGILPRRFQSDRESYGVGDRIKFLIQEVSRPERGGVRIILSRTHSEFISKLFEVEVPEIKDGSVEIYKVVREAGRKTKMAVYTREEQIDPVGACVGMKGVRIRNIITEIDGEKIDVLPYSSDPIQFITSAMAPAQIQQIVVTDELRKNAIAVVDESQLALAIGKQGVNIRLANRLCDWNVEVKTPAEFAEMDVTPVTLTASAHDLFNKSFDDAADNDVYAGTPLMEIPEITAAIVMTLQDHGVRSVEELVVLSDEDLIAALGVDIDMFNTVKDILERHVRYEEVEQLVAEDAVLDADETEQVAALEADGDMDDEDEDYACPECDAPITEEMSTCPGCGVEFAFEEA